MLAYLAPKFIIAGKNAFLTIGAAIITTPLVVNWPDIPIDIAFWGATGGALRWMVTRGPPLQGALGIVIGMVMALGLNGATIPFLGDFITINPSATVGHAVPFLIGAFGVVIYGIIQDIITLKFGEKKNDPK